MSWEKPIGTPWAILTLTKSQSCQLGMLWSCTVSNYLMTFGSCEGFKNFLRVVMIITELPSWKQRLEMADQSCCVNQFNCCTLWNWRAPLIAMRRQLRRQLVQRLWVPPPTDNDGSDNSTKISNSNLVQLIATVRMRVQSSLSSNIHAFLRSLPCWSVTHLNCLRGSAGVSVPFSALSCVCWTVPSPLYLISNINHSYYWLL